MICTANVVGRVCGLLIRFGNRTGTSDYALVLGGIVCNSRASSSSTTFFLIYSGTCIPLGGPSFGAVTPRVFISLASLVSVP